MKEKEGGRPNATLIAGVTIIAVLAILFFGIVVFQRATPKPAPRPVRQPTDVELFVENDPRWDAERLKNFGWIVSNYGRCDEVRTAVKDQTSPEPVWRVHCTGAYSYEATFDEAGKVVKVRPF